jgi:flagellar hook-length control protein FliK
MLSPAAIAPPPNVNAVAPIALLAAGIAPGPAGANAAPGAASGKPQPASPKATSQSAPSFISALTVNGTAQVQSSASTAANTQAGAALGTAPTGTANPQANTATNGSPGVASGAASNGQPQVAPQIPGAAALEARIAVGAPTYLSPSYPALSGLWHHAGFAPGAATPQSGESGGTQTDASGSGDEPPAIPAAAAKLASNDNEFVLTHQAASGSADPSGNGDTSAAPAVAVVTADSTASAAATMPASDGSVTQAANNPQSTVTQPTITAQTLPAYEQVAVNLRQAAQAGVNRIEIQLKPESLGAIHVKLDVTHDGHISAVISADRSDTLNMLRQDSSNLQQALRDAGLQADNSSLSFNLRGDGQAFAQGNPQSSSGSATSADAGPATGTGTDPIASPRTRRHDGALDIEV